MIRFWLRLTLLALPPLLVVVSCVTTAISSTDEKITVNTGPDLAGRIYTTQVIDQVDRVAVHDLVDRSLHLELVPEEWRYDSQTTELTVKRPIPFKNPVYHLEGTGKRPARFLLPENLNPAEEPFVLLGDRIAVEGYDYTWHPQQRLLTFREDLNMEKETFEVNYWTLPEGEASFGNRVSKRGDVADYLMAQRERAAWKRRVESGSAFPFLEKSASGPPHLVMRPPTDAEKKQWLSEPAEIILTRFGISDQEIGKEVGFDTRIPARVVFADQSFCTSGMRMVIQTNSEGKTVRKVVVFFSFSDRIQGQDDAEVALTLGGQPLAPEPDEQEFAVATDVLPGNVVRTTLWGIQTRSDGSRAALHSVYRGVSRGVRFELICSADGATQAKVEQLIASFLKYRN